MEKSQAVRELLIQRYSKLKNVSTDKAKSKFDTMPIDDIIEKHHNAIAIPIIWIVLNTVVIIFQFIILFSYNSNVHYLLPYALLINVLMLILFLNGLRDHLEISHILKVLKFLVTKE
jgi:hypothetical protein